MDYIREALDKAKVSLGPTPGASGAAEAAVAASGAGEKRPQADEPTWVPRQVLLNPAHLERHRIVAFSVSDANHIPFNLLRTRVRAQMAEHSWKTIAVTSPTPACGKTVVSLNLAISLARAGDLKVVLLDLDLKRPAVARTLGIAPKATLGQYLIDNGALADCFVQINANLIVGLNKGTLLGSSELLQSSKMDSLLAFVRSTLNPDVLLVDLPPIGLSDDAIGFLPKVDATLLIAAAGQSKLAQIDECERQISERGKLLGVVLNKAETSGREDYYY